jgi:hypothetical protein
MFLPDLARSLEAAHAVHPYVHQDHVGTDLSGSGHRVESVSRLAHDFDIRFRRKQRPDTLPE